MLSVVPGRRARPDFYRWRRMQSFIFAENPHGGSETLAHTRRDFCSLLVPVKLGGRGGGLVAERERRGKAEEGHDSIVCTFAKCAMRRSSHFDI